MQEKKSLTIFWNFLWIYIFYPTAWKHNEPITFSHGSQSWQFWKRPEKFEIHNGLCWSNRLWSINQRQIRIVKYHFGSSKSWKRHGPNFRQRRLHFDALHLHLWLERSKQVFQPSRFAPEYNWPRGWHSFKGFNYAKVRIGLDTR